MATIDRDKNREYQDDDRRLYYLNELKDKKVHHNDPDIRGWDIYAGDSKIGHVDNLIADVREDVVRYVDVEVENNAYRGSHYHTDRTTTRTTDRTTTRTTGTASPTTGTTGETYESSPVTGTPKERTTTGEPTPSHRTRAEDDDNYDGNLHMILPVGLVKIKDHDGQHRLQVKDIDDKTLRNTPRHRPGKTITPTHEIDVYNVLSRSRTSAETPSYNRKDYLHTQAMDDRFYNTPYFETGGISGEHRSRTRNF